MARGIRGLGRGAFGTPPQPPNILLSPLSFRWSTLPKNSSISYAVGSRSNEVEGPHPLSPLTHGPKGRGKGDKRLRGQSRAPEAVLPTPLISLQGLRASGKGQGHRSYAILGDYNTPGDGSLFLCRRWEPVGLASMALPSSSLLTVLWAVGREDKSFRLISSPAADRRANHPWRERARSPLLPGESGGKGA